MLGMFEEEELAYRAKNEMDKKMSYPMLGLGLQYMLIGENKTASMDSGMKPEMSGMDMIMPMFSISIPIYRNKYKAQQRENRFMWESARKIITTHLICSNQNCSSLNMNLTMLIGRLHCIRNRHNWHV